MPVNSLYGFMKNTIYKFKENNWIGLAAGMFQAASEKAINHYKKI